MAQIQAARGADVQTTVFAAVTADPPSRGMDDLLGQSHRARPRPSPEPLGGLIARIANGTATQDDLSGFPQGVLRYLDAVTTLFDAGVLDLDREVEAGGGLAMSTRNHVPT